MIGSLSALALLVVPRILWHFQLKHGVIEALISPWATFLIILFVGGLFIFPWLKNRKLMIPLVLVLVVGAVALTYYFCDMQVPW